MHPIVASIRSACIPALALCLSGPVFAGPEGGVISGGQGDISTPDANTTNINQYTQNLAIDWRSFNIAKEETVQFFQPSSSATALNRIHDQNPTEIFGSIIANGNVILLNASGVFFSPTASINVNSLIASSLNITNDDFMAGNFTFQAPPGQDGGAVINQGEIAAATGGSVTLMGGTVSNEGVILAHAGQVNLVAGNQVTIDFTGDGLMQFAVNREVFSNAQNLDSAVKNTGTIDATGGTVLMAGSVAAEVFSNVVNNEGMVKAGRIENEGGVIRLVAMGSGGSVINTGTLNADAADATSDGGTIEMTGTNVTQAGTVSANSTGGNGGHVVLQSTDTTLVTGNATISATAIPSPSTGEGQDGGEGGTGGTVHVLGEKVGLLDMASIDVSGALGGGEVLVGGDRHGDNPEIQNATRTYVASGTSITADATENGDGGKVIVWADELTSFNGSITARGGSESGDGGFVETSGKDTLIFTGQVDTTAPQGETGTLLLDPRDITIVDDTTGANDAELADGAILFADGGAATDFTISETVLEGLMSNIILQAQQDIILNDLTDNNLNFSNITAGESVVFQAGRNITFNSTGDTITTAGGDIHLEADSLHSTAGAADGTGSITIGSLSSGGGDITLIGAGFSIGGTVNAGAGNINLSLSRTNVTFTIGTDIPGGDLADLDTTGTLTLGQATTAGTDGAGTGSQVLTVQDISLSANTTIDSGSGSTVQFIANDGMTLNGKTLTTDQATVINVDNDAGDNSGTLIVNKTLSTTSHTLTITANDIDITDSLTSGTMATTIIDSDGTGIGFGATAVGLNITSAELKNITANGLTLQTSGNITVNGIAAADSNNVSGVLTLTANGPTSTVSFSTAESTFNALAVNASDGVTLNTGASVFSDNTGGITIDADADDDGTGDLTVADGETIDTTVGTDQALSITANDINLNISGTLNSGTAATAITDSDGDGIELGDSADVANHLNITDAELGLITATGLTLTTAGDITVGGITSGNSDTIGLLTLTATGTGKVIFNNSPSTFDGGLSVTAAGGITIGQNLTTTNDDVTFNSDVILTNAVTIDTGAGAGTITFSGKLDSDSGNTWDLTLAAGTGNIVFTGAVGSTDALEDLLINSAANVTANAITAESITQTTGTGTTTLNGTVTATVGNIDITADTIAVKALLDTATAANGGSVTLDADFNNAGTGTLTLTADGDINSDGDVELTGNKGIATAGDISTTNGNITFHSNTTLTGDIKLDSSGNGGDVSFEGTLNGTTDGTEDLTITAGGGNVDFQGAAGGTKRLGIIDINSAQDVDAVAITAASLNQDDGTGTTTLAGAVNTNTASGVTIANNSIAVNQAITTTGGGVVTLVADVGNVTLAATNGDINSAGAVTLTASATNSDVIINSGAVITTTAGGVTVNADNITLSGSISAAGQTVTLRPDDAGVAINLGGADANGTLGLSDAELNNITATTLRVGSATSGSITVSAANVGPDNVTTNFSLLSGGGVSQSGSGSISFAGGLRIDVTNAVALVTNANDVDTLAANVSTAGQSFAFLDSDDVTVGTVDGTIGITTNNALVDLRVSGGDNRITVNNGISSSGGQIKLTADEMVISASVNAGAGAITLAPFAANQPVEIGVGAGDTNTLGLLGTELANLTTSGGLTIGTTTHTATVDIVGAVTAANLTNVTNGFTLLNGGDIVFGSAGALSYSGTVTVTTTNGSIQGNSTALTNITAPTVDLTATEGIGLSDTKALELSSQNISAVTTAAGAADTNTIFIDNTSATETTVTDLQTLNSKTSGGTIAISFDQMGGGDLVITGDVSSGNGTTIDGGHITITSANLLTVKSTATISTESGTGGGILITGATVEDITKITAGLGNITLQGADPDVKISAGTTGDVIFNDAPIMLTADRDIIIDAILQTTESSEGTASDVDITLIADANDDGVGGVWIKTGGQVISADNVIIQGADIFATATVGDAILIESDGTNDQILADGAITLMTSTCGSCSASAFIQVDGRLTSSNDAATPGDISIMANKDILLGVDGDLFSQDGNVVLTADAFDGTNTGGVIKMADGTFIDAGSGTITLNADGTVTLGGLATTNTGAAVTITSTSGAIVDGGDTDTDVDAGDGTVALTAATGVGSADALETDAGVITAKTSSGDIQISESDDVTIGAAGLQTEGGFITLTSGGTVDDAGNTPTIETQVAGGAGGAVTITAATGIDLDGTTINTSGDNNGAGAGFAAGDITLKTTAAGDITVNNITSTGGNAGGGDFSGGIGGTINITTTNGAVTVQGTFDTSGGDSSSLGLIDIIGADAGDISIFANGANSLITIAGTAVLTVPGGAGAGPTPGANGADGTITLNSDKDITIDANMAGDLDIQWGQVFAGTLLINATVNDTSAATKLTGGTGDDSAKFTTSGALTAGVLDGGGGTDTLIDDDNSDTFTILTATTGTLGNITETWQNFEILDGGKGTNKLDYSSFAGAVDVAVTDVGSDHGLQGTATIPTNGGFDNIDDISGNPVFFSTMGSAITSSVGTNYIWDLDAGTYSIDGNTVTFTGFNGIISNNQDNTLPSLGDQFNVTGANSIPILINGAATWNATELVPLSSGGIFGTGTVQVPVTGDVTIWQDLVPVNTTDFDLDLLGFQTFQGHLVVGGTIDPIVPQMSTGGLTIDITADTLTIPQNEFISTNGSLTLLAANIVLGQDSFVGSFGFNPFGETTLIAIDTSGTVGNITGPNNFGSVGAVIFGEQIFLIAEGELLNSTNITVFSFTQATVEVATGSGPNIVSFSPLSNAKDTTSISTNFQNILGNVIVGLGPLSNFVTRRGTSSLNPAAELLILQQLGYIDTGLFEQDLSLFGVIGTGIALSLSQCEEIEGCAPNVTEEELNELIAQLEARIEELTRRCNEGDEQACALLAEYEEQLTSFNAYREELKQYLSGGQEEEQEVPDEFGTAPSTTETIESLAKVLEGIKARITWLESLKGDPELRAKLSEKTGIELTQEALDALIEGAKAEAQSIEQQIKLLQEGTQTSVQHMPLFVAEAGDHSKVYNINYGPSLLNPEQGRVMGHRLY